MTETTPTAEPEFTPVSTYGPEDVERFVAALAAVAKRPLGASVDELRMRLATISTVAKALSSQLSSTDPGSDYVNWVQWQTGYLERQVVELAELYPSEEYR